MVWVSSEVYPPGKLRNHVVHRSGFSSGLPTGFVWTVRGVLLFVNILRLVVIDIKQQLTGRYTVSDAYRDKIEGFS